VGTAFAFPSLQIDTLPTELTNEPSSPSETGRVALLLIIEGVDRSNQGFQGRIAATSMPNLVDAPTQDDYFKVTTLRNAFEKKRRSHPWSLAG
jgi:hypothetical protein